MGIRFIIYLDDILIMGESPEEVQRHFKIVTELFISVGFIINWAKSEVSPTQVIEFFGSPSGYSGIIVLAARD